MKTADTIRLLVGSIAVLAFTAAQPSPAHAAPPVLDPIANMSVAGCSESTADQTITATDPDGDPITFTSSGPSFMTLASNPQVGNTRAATIHLAPPLGTSGTFSASVTATAGGEGDTKSFTITITATNCAPTLFQPANMTVNEGAVADQTISATDSNGNPLVFSQVSGPTFMTVTTTTPGSGTVTGNIHLAPGFASSGTYTATVRVTDGSLSDDKSLTITVNNVCSGAPTLSSVSNMLVPTGTTADQTITATSPTGEPMVFTATLPPFATLTSDPQVGNTRTANIHVAPAVGTTEGNYPASVTVTATGSCPGSKTATFTITVFHSHVPPTLNQPADMTVNEGATANQVLTATDPEGSAISFSKTSGPTFMTVTTVTPGAGTATGNIHLAPGFSDSGTYSATVRATGTIGLFNEKSFTITVDDVNRAPVLAQPANMTVNEGAVANQVLSATDPDGDPVTFSKVAGPTFMTVTTTAPGSGTATGNLQLAPGFTDSGTHPATVSASDPFSSTSKSLTITVNNVNRPRHWTSQRT
jgi:hypothetical protein